MVVLRLAGLLALTHLACSDIPAPASAPTRAPTPTSNVPHPPSSPPGTTPPPADSGPTPQADAPSAPLPRSVSPWSPPPTPTPTPSPDPGTRLLPIRSPEPGLEVLTGGRFHLTLSDTAARPRHLTLLADLTPMAELALPRTRAGCARPELVSGRIDATSLTVELRCAAPSPPSTRRHGRARAPMQDTQPPTTLTFDLAALPQTRVVAGSALADTAPLAAIGFPALSPDAIHVALLDRGEHGALRLGVRRVDDGREVFDEALLTPADVRLRPRESAAERHRRLVRAASSRAARVQRILSRVGFTPMTRAPSDTTRPATTLTLPACTPRQNRAFAHAGGLPTFAGCVPGGCNGQAPVLSQWRGGEPGAGLGVEAIELDGAPAGCGPGARWLLRALP